MGPAVVVKGEANATVKLEVVLASCNGERFLDQQLQSLWEQQRRPDRLLLFDDASSDATTTILKRWQQAHPSWIQRLPPRSPFRPQRLGPSQAFNRLLLATTAPYVALCDQDDIWHQDRLSTGLAELQAAEAAHPRGPQQPLLLHSDALLIDADGQQLPGSLWQWHRVKRRAPKLWQLALRNQVTGCTVLCNRALLSLALPIPHTAVLHDWWLALLACREGGLLACPQPLLLHRRHDGNASGPQQGNLILRLNHLRQRLRQWHAATGFAEAVTDPPWLRDTASTNRPNPR